MHWLFNLHHWLCYHEVIESNANKIINNRKCQYHEALNFFGSVVRQRYRTDVMNKENNNTLTSCQLGHIIIAFFAMYVVYGYKGAGRS